MHDDPGELDHVIVVAASADHYAAYCAQIGRETGQRSTWVTTPDQIRGQNAHRGVWLSTPKGWSGYDVDEARTNLTLAVRLGSDPHIEWYPT